MQLHEVDVIQELFSVKDVNEALADGWRIVAVTSSAELATGESAPVACYVMGRRIKKPQPTLTGADIARAHKRS
ncbi:hypothetical protein LOY67_19380 [Pseudomonas sp. B21-056]|jgi:hypothetical protein|uniref:hypothetical protein n=1 Tax=Pseudomonas sp. B21-056 TaxID=2895495 RepID=UPI0022311260|nr:hypothetical protein [Pseudomonas sp. B21-056]UZE22187.1 hypothetical protein LOY67_19380 [Pseudomonas sp. B21-056]